MMKKAVLEIIDYLRYQVVNDKCTTEELRSIYELTSESLKVSATIDDLAEFYGQSKNNVSNVLSRRPIPRHEKPKRKVYYNFAFFRKIIPKSWRKS